MPTHFDNRRLIIQISIVTHTTSDSLAGNRVTTNRWAKIFRNLGHQVSINKSADKSDVLIAIHAERSARKFLQFQKTCPSRPTILLLAGTDIYAPTGFSNLANDVLKNADHLVTLETNALQRLNAKLRRKATTIMQSAIPPNTKPKPLQSCFEISLCGHLRAVKQPFMATEAVVALPSSTKVKINHYGNALNKSMHRAAMRWTRNCKRYRWAGPKPHWQTRRLVARSRLSINTSLIESCANSIVESIVAGTPVLASDIEGNTGLLGKNYPGLFAADSVEQLTDLICRAECDRDFLKLLKNRCNKIAKKLTPRVERTAWQRLLSKIQKELNSNE